ncbi:homoserine kinase [Blastomonas marina]|uniref:homoserine kinase n=1 Tax=Blastomonas marina TaxID=1867408 RepID=UPI002AC901F8|nr:homoserine kinase [Blastomonas marina]WPZ02832.1 homoserine kinase [Blastomonas marina]
MAVFTALDEDELAAFLQAYGLSSDATRTPLEGGVSNSNWCLDFGISSPALVLTVIEPPIARSELDFVFAFQRHLDAKGLPLAAPLGRSDGSLWGTLAGKPALLSPFLPGTVAVAPDSRQAGQMGELLARMHLDAADFTPRRSNPMGLPDMAAIVRRLDPLAIETAVPGLAADLASAFSEALDDWPQGLPAGAVHCDLFPDNVLFAGPRLSGAIDFYFSCTAPFAYDLAMTHAAWCFTPGDSVFREDVSAALLDAYARSRALSSGERAALPLLARVACLRILATRLRDWISPPEGASVTAKHPAEFAQRLRFYSGDRGARAFAP